MGIASAQLLDTALPVLAGTSFATVGITYQMAQNRKVTPLRVFLLLAICGTALFTVKCLTAEAVDLSSRALLLGIVAGLSQYLSIKLVGRAMALGPFSLVWCVLSLAFAPVALYAATVQGSPQHWTLWLAVGAAALCCILAAAGHGDPSSTAPPTIRAKLAYGFLLVVILFINAISQISIQDLNITAAGRPRDAFFLCLYIGIAVASLIDAISAEELGATIRRAWFPGLLAGIGSVCGMLLLGAGSARTGASAFLICSMVMLILPMLAAVLFFHERVTVRWIGTLILGLAAIGLANFRLLRELL